MKRRSKKGFTLAELLIVIAILAVLIAILLPVFGSQLNKARAAAELANVRAKYSELVADGMLGSEKTLNEMAAKVSINFSDLKAATQYDSTIIFLSKDAPSTAPTTEVKATPNDVNGADYYLTVAYKDYYGTFTVDSDVTIADTTSGGEGS